MNLTELKKQILPEFESNFHTLFKEDLHLSSRLNQAMSYSSLNGGKRLRPLLVYATLDGFNKDLGLAKYASMAIELIHCYSLIHDDLPALDNDDLRRNLPTCHKKFDECTAILAGDALQTLAFEVLTKSQQALPLVEVLAKAAGANGMVGGQMLDMLSNTNENLTLATVKKIHANKTGALIRASIISGGILAQANKLELEFLAEIADNLGIAFQIQDDILDITATTEQLGKTAAVDLEQNKASFVNVFGLERARLEVEKLLDLAMQSIAKLENKNRDFTALKDLALYIIRRNK